MLVACKVLLSDRAGLGSEICAWDSRVERRDRIDDGSGAGGENVGFRKANAAADHYPGQENDDGDDRRGHEHENKLFSVQLNLVNFVIRHRPSTDSEAGLHRASTPPTAAADDRAFVSPRRSADPP